MDAYEFILTHIDSVPHLEALMLLWTSRPVGWTCEELASRLYVSQEKVNELLRDLVRRQLIADSAMSPRKYSYLPRAEDQNEMMRQLDAAYRRDHANEELCAICGQLSNTTVDVKNLPILEP